MNGLSLPVCWCGCDGPNPEFTTNGQKMVTTGGVGDSTGLIEQQMQEDCRTDADERAEARMLDALDGTVDVDGESYRRLPLEVARRLLNADTTTFDAFITAFRSHDYRHSAALLGVPSVAFRDTASESSRVAKAVCNLTGEAWSVIRHILNGESQERVGRLHGCVSTDGHVQVGISKQAVNKRVWNAIESHPWIGVALGYTTGKYTTAHPPARARCRDTISEK